MPRREGKILSRSKQEIEKSIDDFVLIFDQEQLVACAGLKDCQEGFMEDSFKRICRSNSVDYLTTESRIQLIWLQTSNDTLEKNYEI